MAIMRTNEKKQHEGRLQAINNTRVEEVQGEREYKKIDAHTALANKVDAIRTLNKQSTEWTVAQTKTMATCYKRAGNLPFPTTKQLLLTRYHDTMMCGDAAVPVATAMAPLPHPT